MSSSPRPSGLISPFGGRLVDLVVPDEERAALLERAQRLPRVALSLRAQYDLEMLAVGAFSPLDRLMGADDYGSVLGDLRLGDGTVFPLPVTLPVRAEDLHGAPDEVALTDDRGAVLAVLAVDEVYPVDVTAEMRAVLGTADRTHPLVAESAAWPGHYVAGRPRVLELPRHRLHGALCRTPAATRARLAALGHAAVVAFQTRNPMHRIHEEITKRAARAVGGALLIHPAVGVTRPEDVHHALRVEAYEVLVRNYYDPAATLLSLMPLAMRFAGPREAVWHMIVRRNYGASHLIVGRDHAGPGKDSRGEPVLRPVRGAGDGRGVRRRGGRAAGRVRGARLPRRRGPIRSRGQRPARRTCALHLRDPGAQGVPGHRQEAARLVHAARGGRDPAEDGGGGGDRS